MSVFDCLSIMIPLVSSMLALQFFSTLSAVIPVGGVLGQPVLTLVLIYINTYLYAKIKCWKSDKSILGRAVVPTLIFLVWAFAFVFPLTAPIMMGLGNSPFLIVLLSLLYKTIFDKMFDC